MKRTLAIAACLVCSLAVLALAGGVFCQKCGTTSSSGYSGSCSGGGSHVWAAQSPSDKYFCTKCGTISSRGYVGSCTGGGKHSWIAQ